MHLAGMNRYQAFGIHFGISLMIFIGLVAMVLFVWYPGVLREVDSSWQQALIMIAGVDLVLGPLLTLIVFNPAKKSLKMDLSIIAVAQIAALVAGTYTVHQARPVALYVSFPPQGFEILTANSLSDETRLVLSESDTPFYYYSGKELLGPQNPMDLKPTELSSTQDGKFIEFLAAKAPEELYMRENEIVLSVALKPVSLIFDQNGRFLNLETPTSD